MPRPDSALAAPVENPARCVAFVGPQGAGKTALVRALARRAAGEAPALDTAPEAGEFGATTEPGFVNCAYLGQAWTFIDCPGSVELLQASHDAMRAADIVVVVAEPNPARAASLSPYFKYLDDWRIPHALFVNRLDETRTRIRDLLDALQTYSDRPLVLRQVPIRERDAVVGAVDLVSERAWKYREGAPSELIDIPETARPREEEARDAMLDTLADFDDGLMEQILEDKVPPSSAIFTLMKREVEDDAVAPVMLGSAVHGNGVTRLLKLLRHETPSPVCTAERNGFSGGGNSAATIIRTTHLPHVGKISLARIWKGGLKDGDSIEGGRLSGMLALNGDARVRKVDAACGDIAGLPRFDALATGDLLIDGKLNKGDAAVPPLTPLYALAVRARNERDDVRLSAALAKLIEEDSSLSTERRPETGELVLHGQGDMHLRLAAAKLKNRYNLEIDTAPPRACYRETIRAGADHHARHKKQSGGHGQFADIRVKIRPAARGAGVSFEETIHGGAVPRQFIPAVEAGVREELKTGPLGFPATDLTVTLYDGQHHAVDSNEMSFKLAGRQAVREALPDCQPVLLEPIHLTTIHTPREHTSKAHAAISSRRGQILGFDARAGWPGWDSISAMMPEAALYDLIIDLRSLTQGNASFEQRFDHYQELNGKDAERIIEARRRALSAGT